MSGVTQWIHWAFKIWAIFVGWVEPRASPTTHTHPENFLPTSVNRKSKISDFQSGEAQGIGNLRSPIPNCRIGRRKFLGSVFLLIPASVDAPVEVSLRGNAGEDRRGTSGLRQWGQGDGLVDELSERGMVPDREEGGVPGGLTEERRP